MNATVKWNSEMSFSTIVGSGGTLNFDADLGPTPMEALLCSLAACSAMDVISILKKKRQEVISYELEVIGERPEAGTYPRPFLAIKIRHVFSGVNLDPVAVARAIELSEEKYCSVAATLRECPKITSEFELESSK